MSSVDATVPSWSQKNGDARRTGYSTRTSTLNLAKPKWLYEEPGNGILYNTPVLDGKGNAYTASTAGELFSVKVADGSTNWLVYTAGNFSTAYRNIPNPVILGDSIYIMDVNGTFFSFALSDGSVQWSIQLATGKAGGDAWSLGGRDNIVLTVGRMQGEIDDNGSGTWLFAVDTTQKSVAWKQRLPFKVYNVLPAIAGDKVVVGSATGAIACYSLADGAPLWNTPENVGTTFSTGGVAIGSNDIIYLTSNDPQNNGFIRAHYLSNGAVKWERLFSNRSANAGPAVYPLPGGKLAVVTGIGINLPTPFKVDVVDALYPNTNTYQVVAVDADNGQDLWSVTQKTFNSQAAVNSTFEKTCWPDSYSNAAVDAAGTVYVGWYGGQLLAIDGYTGQQIAQYDLYSGIQGEPAIDDGVLVVASCNRMAAFANL